MKKRLLLLSASAMLIAQGALAVSFPLKGLLDSPAISLSVLAGDGTTGATVTAIAREATTGVDSLRSL